MGERGAESGLGTKGDYTQLSWDAAHPVSIIHIEGSRMTWGSENIYLFSKYLKPSVKPRGNSCSQEAEQEPVTAALTGPEL